MVIVLKDKKLMFVHNRKTAGCTITEILAPYTNRANDQIPEDKGTEDTELFWQIRYHEPGNGIKPKGWEMHTGPGDMPDLPWADPEWSSFIVFREPMERLEAIYRWHVRRKGYTKDFGAFIKEYVIPVFERWTMPSWEMRDITDRWMLPQYTWARGRHDNHLVEMIIPMDKLFPERVRVFLCQFDIETPEPFPMRNLLPPYKDDFQKNLMTVDTDTLEHAIYLYRHDYELWNSLRPCE